MTGQRQDTNDWVDGWMIWEREWTGFSADIHTYTHTYTHTSDMYHANDFLYLGTECRLNHITGSREYGKSFWPRGERWTDIDQSSSTQHNQLARHRLPYGIRPGYGSSTCLWNIAARVRSHCRGLEEHIYHHDGISHICFLYLPAWNTQLVQSRPTPLGIGQTSLHLLDE